MGSKKQDWYIQTTEREKTYWFDLDVASINEEPALVDGELNAGSLKWLIDLVEQEGEQGALKRAARSIRAFHETHIGAGTLERIECAAGKSGAAGAYVSGLGIEPKYRLEIVHDNRHGIEGFDGNITYAVLWSHDGEKKTWEYVSGLADLRTVLGE